MADDITQGLLMANGSGFDAADERLTVLATCDACGGDIVHGGDRSILRRRTATEAGVLLLQEVLLGGIQTPARNGVFQDSFKEAVRFGHREGALCF